MHVCFLTNGYGEDRSAALIGCELRSLRHDITISGAPLVTPGHEYEKHGFPVLYRGKVPPSGGFPTTSMGWFLRDLLHIGKGFGYYRALKRHRSEIDYVVAVGDFVLMMLGHYALRQKMLFLALAKSDHKRPHLGIEEHFLRRIPFEVLTRDSYTAEQLRVKGVNATFLGNPIMDALEPKGIEITGNRVVGVLPGSRAEAFENFRRILAVIDLVQEPADYYCAVPGALDFGRFLQVAAETGWETGDHDKLTRAGRTVHMVRNGFEDIIARAEVLIGLAGTANEQAVGMGKPVVSFAGTGPQTTVTRMTKQEMMLGGSVRYIADFPRGVAEEVSFLLSHPEEAMRRGRIGIERMGSPGASRRIAEHIAETLPTGAASSLREGLPIE